MPNTQRYYRLRIRAADDLSDALVLTSVPGGTNPYLVKPFTGDGRSFDPLTGDVTTGSYNVEVIDALTGANTRVVTAVLADANARQQLLSRKAYGETSANGSSWSPLFGGYVNSLRLVSAIKFNFAIGETRRVASNRDVFKSTALTVDFTGKPLTFSVFDKVTCIFGGPIRGGWMSLRDLGGWRFKVSQVHVSPNYVQMKLLRAFDPTKPEHGTFSTLSTAIVDAMTARARSYYRESPIWKASTIRGHFPGILYRVQSTTGTLIGNFTPLSEPTHPDKATAPDIFTRNGEASIWVDWTAAAPSVGDQYDVYMYPTDISGDNPLHVFEHPVDMRQKLWDESGIAYDASVLAGVRSTIGDEVRLALRITRSPGKLKDFEATLNGLFGMATRSNGSGAEVLFAHRIKLATTPSTVVTISDLRDASGSPFELDEATVTNKVTIKQKRLFPRLKTDEATVDGIVAVDQAITVNNSDADITAYGDKETVYEIEGQIVTNNAQQDFDLEKYALGVAREIFDRWGRGAIGGELHCLPSVTVDVGAEFQVNIPQLPNAQVGASPVSQRGGARIVQVVRRTELPSGADLYVLDSGTTAQPGTLPTFSIAANASDAFHFLDLVITNAATLAAAGYFVRIELGIGSSTPTAGTLLSVVDPSVLTSLTIPAHDSGVKVWARMRSEKEGYRPSSWTAFAGVQLTVLDAVTALAVSAEDPADPSKRLLTWTVGANASLYPVEVLIRLTSEASTADRLVAILPPGSTQYQLLELDIANRTATVRHRETAPFNGVSADSTIAVNTVNGAATLAAPTNPVAFSSRHKTDGGLLPLGTYGIDVNSAVFPCGVEISVKVGAGAYEVREIVPAQPFGATRWMGIAPNDGQTRFIKARHVLAGYTSSAFCAEVSVVPWSPTRRIPDLFSSDGATILIDAIGRQVQPGLLISQSTSFASQGSIVPIPMDLQPFSYNSGGPANGRMWSAISWSAFTAYRADGSSISIPASASYAAPPTPTLTQVAGGALGARTRFVRIGYRKNNMIVRVGPEASLAISAGNLLKVTDPGAVTGYDGWVALVGSASNGEFFQTVSNFGSDFTEPTVGFNSTTTTPYDNSFMPNGVTAIGLQASSTYFFYPWYDLPLTFVVFDDAGHLSKTATSAQKQNMDGRIALSAFTGMTALTPTAGTTGSGLCTNGGGKFL